MDRLKELIEQGAKKMNGQKELARYLGEVPQNLTNAKAGKRGLPIEACIKLAQLLEIEPLEVIAASELTTAKKPEKVAFWTPFVRHAQTAGIALAVATVTNFVTPGTAEAHTKPPENAMVLDHKNYAQSKRREKAPH